MEYELIDNDEIMLRKCLTFIIGITFLFSAQLRMGLLGTRFGSVNYIASIALIYILFMHTKKNSISYLMIWCIISYYFIGAAFYYQDGLIKIINTYISFILPLILIGIKLNKEQFKIMYKMILTIFNIVIIIITILGIIDYFINYEIILVISNFMQHRIRELIIDQKSQDVYRMYSLMGHPLFNTQLYLMFYVWNILYNRYFNKLIHTWLILIVTLIGISLTASKAGLVLYFLCIVFISGKRIRLRYYIAVIFSIIIVLKVGIFNNTIIRLNTESITTGRAEKWDVVSKSNYFPIKFFTGYGTEFTFKYNEIIDWASAAFEYPFRMFSLELGSLMMIMIYFCIAIYPMYILIKRKHFTILFAYLIVFIDVNTYNGLSIIGDYMLIFSVFIMIILNLSSCIITENTHY